MNRLIRAVVGVQTYGHPCGQVIVAEPADRPCGVRLRFVPIDDLMPEERERLCAEGGDEEEAQ